MLRRNNSKSTLGRRSLGRSRSSTSIGRNPVHDLVSIEPSAAERDAYIAANLSYLKAQIKERVARDVATLPADAVRATLPSRNSFTSDPDPASRANTIHWSHSVAGSSPNLRRQQSVRFAGPHARPGRPLATRASVYLVAPKSTSLTAGCIGTGSVGAENQRPGTVSPATRKLRKHASVQNDRYTPRTSTSFYFSEEDYAAPAAPSYRKLRKSRSMYTASVGQSSTVFGHRASGSGSGSGSGDRLREWLAAPAHPSTTKENRVPAPELRAPRSMSFLPHASNAAHYRSHAERDLAARLSQDNVRSDASCGQPAELKSKPSSIFRSRSRRPQSSGTLPRTLRNSSETSGVPPSAWSGDTLSISKQAAIRTTARKVSRSLKSRIKGLFSRPKSIDHPPGYAPIQHDRSPFDSDSCMHLDGSTIQPQGASVSAVRSRIPAFHAVPPTQQLKSRQGSFEMVRGEDQAATDDKSRVTSWTTSTVNTVDSREVGAHGNWEDRHIAAIREIGGTHASSPAPGLPSRPLNGTSWGTGNLHQAPIVDSQRVYSALLKRLEASHPQGSRPPQARQPASHSGSPLGKGQSRDPLREGSSTSTIRCVREDDDVFGDGARDSVSPANASESTESVIRHGTPRATAPLTSKLSIQPGAHLEPPKALPTRSSAFFGSPTCHLFRTASPYRRALRESMKASEESTHTTTTDGGYMGSLSEISLPARCPSPEESRQGSQETCAESIYSSSSSPRRRPDGTVQDHVPSTSRDSTDTLDPDEHGAATVYLNPSIYKLARADVHKRHVSTASSVEWKTWLSANVSKLEVTGPGLQSQFPEDPEHARRPFGHVREEAEIEPDGGALGQEEPEPAASPVTLPLRLVEDSASAQSTPRPAMQSPGEIWRRRSQIFNENTPPKLDRPKEACSRESSPLKPSRTGLCSLPSSTNIKTPALLPLDSRALNSTADLPRMKSLSSLARTSPSREELLQKRRSRTRLRMGDSAKSSPSLSSALERQFGNANANANANAGSPGWARAGRLESVQAEGSSSDGDGGAGGGGGAQALSSKRMVDLFLSSRRRRMGSETRQSSESFTDAFI